MVNMALLRSWLSIIPRLVVDDGACLVGARHGAIAASDAGIVVHSDETVGALRSGPGWAHWYAWRLSAVLAAGNQEQPFNVGKGAALDVEHAAPLDAGRSVGGMFTSDGASLSADAAV